MGGDGPETGAEADHSGLASGHALVRSQPASPGRSAVGSHGASRAAPAGFSVSTHHPPAVRPGEGKSEAELRS